MDEKNKAGAGAHEGGYSTETQIDTSKHNIIRNISESSRFEFEGSIAN